MKTLLRMRSNHFQNEAYIPQLFPRSSHLENLKCLNGVEGEKKLPVNLK